MTVREDSEDSDLSEWKQCAGARVAVVRGAKLFRSSKPRALI